jgi:hypothetical protein
MSASQTPKPDSTKIKEIRIVQKPSSPEPILQTGPILKQCLYHLFPEKK